MSLLTNKGLLTANREGVDLNGEVLFATQTAWDEAMLKQLLSEFADNIEQKKPKTKRFGNSYLLCV